MDDTERLERRRASARAYHARNREKVREQSRAWREANLEYARSMHNLQWLCFACNRAKGARMPEQYHGCPVFWGAPLD